MINNFGRLLTDISAANNRSQLEYAYDTAMSFLTAWEDAQAISEVDFLEKKSALDNAYHNQLTDFTKSPVSGFIAQLHTKITSEISS